MASTSIGDKNKIEFNHFQAPCNVMIAIAKLINPVMNTIVRPATEHCLP